MTKNALLSIFFLSLFVFSANAQDYLWPVQGQKAGTDIIKTPQGYIDGEHNFAKLFIGGNSGDTIVSPVNGTVSDIAIIYNSSLKNNNTFNINSIENWDEAIERVKANQKDAGNIKPKFICGSITIRTTEGTKVHISGLNGDFRFKTGEKITEGIPIGIMGYSYHKITEPSITVSVSSKDSKPIDPMTPFGLKTTFIKPGEAKPIKRLSKTDAKEDYTIYFRALQELYPTFNYLIPEEEQEDYLTKKLRMIDEKAKGDSIDYSDYRSILSQDNSRIHDSHLTRITPSWDNEMPDHQPGIFMGIVGDTMYCTTATKDYEYLIGQPFLEFNGYNADSARQKMYETINEYDANVEDYKKYGAATIRFGILFKPDSNFDAVVMLADSSVVTIKGHDFKKGYPDYRKDVFTFLMKRNPRKNLSMQMLNDSTAYLDIATFQLNEIEIDSIRNFINSIDTIPNFIIDVRYNTGGDIKVMQKIYSFLAGESMKLNGYNRVNKQGGFISFEHSLNYHPESNPFSDYLPHEGKNGYYQRNEDEYLINPDSLTNYKGRIYMLTNEHSTSAATALPGLLVRNHRGVTVGRETRTAYHYMTANKNSEIRLPHSQIVVHIPMVEIVFDTEVNDRVPYGRGVLPDYEVPLSLAEIWSETPDTILSYTLGLIDRGEYINYDNPFVSPEVKAVSEARIFRFKWYILGAVVLIIFIIIISYKKKQ